MTRPERVPGTSPIPPAFLPSQSQFRITVQANVVSMMNVRGVQIGKGKADQGIKNYPTKRANGKMTQHVVIRRLDYVAGSSEKPAVKVFTQSHASRPPVPWGKLSIGDIAWMKWRSGPIVARGIVEGFRQIHDCTPDILRNTVGGTNLYDLVNYWNALPPVFFGMAIFVGQEQWLDSPIFPKARSYSESWIVLDSPEKEAAWLHDTGEKQVAAVSLPQKSRGSRTLPLSVRFTVLRRDNYTCRYCGAKAPFVSLQVDHVTPWAMQGASDLSNLVTACKECNLGKSSRTAELQSLQLQEDA
jgi:hypothetical protein